MTKRKAMNQARELSAVSRLAWFVVYDGSAAHLPQARRYWPATPTEAETDDALKIIGEYLDGCRVRSGARL